MIRKFFIPKVLIGIGVIMNVAAALISSLVISGNEEKIKTLSNQSVMIEQTLSENWQNTNDYEKRGHAVILLNTMYRSNKDPELKNDIDYFLRKMLNRLDGEEKGVETFYSKNGDVITKEITDHILKNRTNTIENINDLYLKRIEMQKEISAMQAENQKYINYAIFLQIMGLIFVLSKDIARRN